MTKKELINKLAYFESINDQLATEISYVDSLMKTIGFTDGLATLKLTAKEMIEEEHDAEEVI